jgi:hypothetical protein
MEELVTNIGQIKLTDNQTKNWDRLPASVKGIWLRISYTGGTVFGVSEVVPQASDILSLTNQLAALSDSIPIDEVLNAFDPELAIGSEIQVFDEDALIRFMPCAYMINTLIQWKNFWGGLKDDGTAYPGLKQLGLKLISVGTITQADYDNLNSILKQQGIDLNAG